MRNRQSIEECVRNSDTVYNLIGRDYETKNFSFYDVHVEGAKRIAEACAKYETDRLVHVSALSASRKSPSAFLMTKSIGEEIVKDIFPAVTIVRLGNVWGAEDRFTNWKAPKTGIRFAINEDQTVTRPVAVSDVARALELMMYHNSTIGKTYELYGPDEMSIKEVLDFIKRQVWNEPRTINVSKRMAQMLWAAWRFPAWPTKWWDALEREYIDASIDPSAYTFKDIPEMSDPIPLRAEGANYLRVFRGMATQDEPMDRPVPKQDTVTA